MVVYSWLVNVFFRVSEEDRRGVLFFFMILLKDYIVGDRRGRVERESIIFLV